MKTPEFEAMFGENVSMEFHTNTSVVSCEICNGSGYYEREELSCYHKREYDTTYKDCTFCGGKGRRVKVVTSTRIRRRHPFHDIVHEDTKFESLEDGTSIYPEYKGRTLLYFKTSEGVIR